MDGRKVVGGKVEVKIRIRDPIVGKEVEQVQEKWTVLLNWLGKIYCILVLKKVNTHCDDRNVYFLRRLLHNLNLKFQLKIDTLCYWISYDMLLHLHPGKWALFNQWLRIRRRIRPDLDG